jgi:hypothetical protein
MNKALSGTSRPWASWYAIPADDKHYMRLRVAEIVVDMLKSLDLKYPTINQTERAPFAEMRRLLKKDRL